MKKTFSLLLSVLLLSQLFSNVTFSIDYANFQFKNKPYTEFYLSVNGGSLGYAMVKQDGDQELFQASVEMTYLIEKGTEVIAFEKFQINTPLYTEAEVNNNPLDLIDLKRLTFPAGEYTYSIIAKDLVNQTTAEASGTIISVATDPTTIQLSEMQLGNEIEPTTKEGQFSKVGYDISPNVSHNYIRDNNKLSAYFEIYNANKLLGDSADYFIDISIRSSVNEQLVGNLRAIKRLKATEITAHIQPFNIDKLPTGSYEVLVECKNRNNEVIQSTQVQFFRLNPDLKDLDAVSIEGTFVDSIRNTALLAEYIKSVRVISEENEKTWADNQLSYAELEFMQRYFLNFWRNRNQLDPGYEWEEYKRKLALVDEKFGYGGVKGYQTDRGRIYLQYGAPTDVQDVKYDSDNHPYSIWRYYKLTECYRTVLNGLTDRKFVFYSPTNEMLGYEVLHSNVPGEVQNDEWEFTINKKSITKRPGTREGQTLQGQDRARDLFNNPR
jgi:GWxTD domain-containing protein